MDSGVYVLFVLYFIAVIAKIIKNNKTENPHKNDELISPSPPL